MGLLTSWLGKPSTTVEASLATVDWQAQAGSSYYDLAGLGLTVSRAEAMAVPAVARARGIITGTIAHLPLQLHHDGELAAEDTPPPWVSQPDPSVPAVVSLAWTVDDMLFHGRSYWQVHAVYADTGKPRWFRRVEPSRVGPQLSADGSRITAWTVDGERVPPRGLGSILPFHGVDDGVLARGAITITTALELERAAYRYAETPMPSHALRNTGADLPPAKRDELLADWKAARRSGSVGYLNHAVELVTSGFDPKALQLVEAREHAATECARLMGVDPSDVGAESGGSMTYANSRDKRRQLVDSTLRPYLAAIEQRLSMPDVLPRGWSVRFDLTEYLRADAQERADYLDTMLAAGVLTIAEARAAEGLPPLDADEDDTEPAETEDATV